MANSLKSKIDKLFAAYKKRIVENPQLVSEVEVAVKWLSYFSVGHFNNSNLALEIIYSMPNLIMLSNDMLMYHSSSLHPKIPQYESKIKIWLTVLEYTQTLLEATGKKLGGEMGRWIIIAVVQFSKAILRLLLIYVYKERITKNPSVPPLNRKIFNKASGNLQLKEGFKLKRSGVVVRAIKYAEPVQLRTWKALPCDADENQNFSKTYWCDISLKIAESLYVIKPLIYLGSISATSQHHWQPWILSLLIDSTSSSCGIRKIPPSSHPVGQAAYGAYPWQVAILANDNNYIGGGVLISPTHVLTVAHKVANYVNGGIKARLGEWDAQSTTEPNPHVDISVSSVTLHPQYNSENLQNDIAVLKLSSAAPISTSPNINTACLPSAAPASGTRCWVSGWGKDAFGPNGKYQSILKEVDVPVLTQANCQAALRSTRLGQFFVLDNSFMCAGGEKGKDACTGDGGSPLVCSNNGPFQVVGLVTWGIGCAGAGVPGVYINVFNFFSWIMQQMT